MTPQQEMVLQFHKLFRCTVNDVPTVPSLADKQCRVRLIAEELQELSDAFTHSDVVEIADALGDLLYVVLGTAVCCGIDIGPVFAEIHRSNMSKLWTAKEVTDVTLLPAGATAVLDVTVTDSAHRSHVVTASDGKVIKSPSYSRADVAGVLAGGAK